MMQYAITTQDNPINPLDDFRAWFVFDSLVNHYNTCDLLSRIAKTSDGLTDEENNQIISDAIDRIVATIPDPNGKSYVKVSKDISETIY
jgi:hypothetical protein